ncbi:GGDEF domain-containing protein [Fusibacter sp. JL298sf-3]
MNFFHNGVRTYITKNIYQDYLIEKILLMTFYAGNIVISLLTMVFHYAGSIDIVIVSQTLHAVFSLLILNAFAKKATTKRMLLFASAYSIVPFLGMWASVSFKHPMVILYSTVLLIVDVLVFSNRTQVLVFATKFLLIVGLFAVDYSYRAATFPPIELDMHLSFSITIMQFLLFFTMYTYAVIVKEYKGIIKMYSYIDPLTGIKNKRSFDDDLIRIEEKFARYAYAYAMVFLDVDDFKDVNDGYGHTVGDQVLKYIANTIKGSVRKSDEVYRMGGDEFIIILDETNYEEAMYIMRSIFSDKNTVNHFEFDIVISYGVASRSEIDGEVRSLTHLADQRMYHSKKEKGKVRPARSNASKIVLKSDKISSST